MSADKSALRKAFLLRRKQFLPQEKAEMDAAITAKVLQSDAYRTAQTVFCYVSVQYEVDTRAILADAWKRGKRVAVPRCRKNGHMDFYAVSSADELSPGMRGIPEPDEMCPLLYPQPSDVCIVPCLALDDRGFRLGYGGGYYDRYLAQYSMRTIGLCYAACRTTILPSESFDVPIQILVSEIGGLTYGRMDARKPK